MHQPPEARFLIGFPSMETYLINISDKAIDQFEKRRIKFIIQDLILYTAKFKLLFIRTVDFPEESTRKII